MFDTIRIAPSILSADFMNMETEIRKLEEAGADFIHVDVMDGHFVPNLTLGVPFVKQLRALTSLPLDVHLMISNPLYQLPWFLEAGPDWVTVHWETLDEGANEVETALALIRDAGVKAGLAMKPDTSTRAVEAYLELVDMVLPMSVYPGFSGQAYIEGSEERVVELVHCCRHRGVSPLIQVDGGIDEVTAALMGAAGADVLVAGKAVFGASDPKEAVSALRLSAQAAQNTIRDASRNTASAK